MLNSHRFASLVLLSALSVTSPSLAEPSGGEVRAGSATIQQTLGTTTVQQLTDRAIIDWQRFSVSRDELVRFVQPSEMAVILNRVVGQDPSRIMGKLQANGQVFLVNPNGILFGPESRVDVGSLVATTLSLSNQDFLDGNYRFTQDPSFDLASVVNQGELRVSDEGYLILTAPLVSNEGLIVANLGKVALGAGTEATVNLDGRNLVSFQLGSAPSADGTVTLTPGAVSEVLAQVVQDGEMVPAGELVEENGTVRLVGGEGVLVQAGTVTSGSVELDSTRSTVLTEGSLTAGGPVNVWGESVVVAGRVEASSPTAGGTIRVGSDVRGQGAERAHTTKILPTATLEASATEAGDGGTIVVWAERRVDVAGTLVAEGAGGGRGGFVETSGKSELLVTGDIRTGAGGEWLIDPANLTIATSNGLNQISNAVINIQLNAGGIMTLDAQGEAGTDDGNITQLAGADIVKSSGSSPALLRLVAGNDHGDITLNGNLSKTGGAGVGSLSVLLEAGYITGGDVTINGDILLNDSANDGAFVADGKGAFTQGTGSIIDAGSGVSNVSIVAGGNVRVADVRGEEVSVLSTGGNIERVIAGKMNLTGSSSMSLASANGIGSPSASLLIKTPSLTSATVSGSGDIHLQTGIQFLIAGTDLTVDSISTPNGDIVVAAEQSASLTVKSASSANGSIDLSATKTLAVESVVAGLDVTLQSNPTYDVELGAVTAGGAVTVTAGLDILDGNAGQLNVTAPAATLLAGRGIYADLAVPNVEVEYSRTDPLGEFRGVVLTNNTAVDATLSLNAFDYENDVAVDGHAVFVQTGGGTLTVTDATTAFGSDLSIQNASGDLRVAFAFSGRDLVLDSDSGSVFVDFAHAGIDETLTIYAAGSIEEYGLDETSENLEAIGGGINLYSGTGVGTSGALELESLHVLASATGPGDINLSSLDPNPQLTVTTANGDVSLTGTSGLTATSVAAGGNGDVQISAPTSANLRSVTASGNEVVVTATSIHDSDSGTDDVDITADSIVLSAANGIGSSGALEIQADTSLVSSTTTADGDTSIALQSALANGGNLSVTTNDGDVDISGGTLLSFTEADDYLRGSYIDGNLSFTNAGGAIADGNNAIANIQAGTLNLTGNSIGTSTDPVEVTVANSLETTTTAADGPTYIALSSALASGGALSVTTNDGDVVITGATSLTFVDTTDALTANYPDGTVLFSNTGGGITDGNGASVNIAAQNLGLTSTAGIGTPADPLEIETDTLVHATVTGNGSIGLEDLSVGLAVSSATTVNGDIALTVAEDDLVAALINAGGSDGDVTLAVGNGWLLLGDVRATDDITATVVGRIVDNNFGPNLTATGAGSTVTLSALSGIGTGNPLEIDVRTLSATTFTGGIVLFSQATQPTTLALLQTTGAGNIDFLQVGAQPLTVTSASTNAGDLDIEASSLIVGPIVANGDLSLTGANGMSFTGMASATGDVFLSSDDVISSGQVSGQLLTLDNSLGDVFIDDAQVVSVTGTVGGDFEITETNDLIVSNLSVGNVVMTTGGDLDIQGPLTATGTINLDSGAGIAGAGVVTAPTLQATAVDGIELDVDVQSLHADVTGAGSIGIDQADGAGSLTVTLARTANGSIRLGSADPLTLQSILAQGAGSDVSVTTANLSPLVVDSVVADDVLSLDSAFTIGELNQDLQADLQASTLDLDAARAIGTGANVLEIEADLLSAHISGAGLMNVQDVAGGLEVTGAQTSDGLIRIIAANGDLTVHTATAQGTGRNLTVTATGSGNLRVGQLTAADDNAFLNAGASILDLDGDAAVDLIAKRANLIAQTGIDLETSLEVIGNATADTSGDVLLTEANALQVNNIQATSGSVNLSANGPLTVGRAFAGGAGDLALTNTGSGDMLVGLVNASGDTVTLNSAGRVLESGDDPDADILAADLVVTSAGLGDNGAFLETDITRLTAAVSGTGRIVVSEADALQVLSASTASGTMLVRAGGNLSLFTVDAGGNATFETLGAGNVLIDDVAAAGSLTVTAFGAINELNPDAATDLAAGTTSTLRANNGAISALDALEVQITTGVLNVLAGGQVGGVSIKLAGTVAGSGSPTGTLIHLNTPPGTSTFNGITF